MDYRKLYEERYNITIPEGYDIHHIDLNHANDDIQNLLLMPHDLHMRLHECIKSNICTTPVSALQFEWCSIPAQCAYVGHYLAMYGDVYSKIEGWAAAKQFEGLRAQGYKGYMPYNYKGLRNE